jgi:hypothetical protein
MSQRIQSFLNYFTIQPFSQLTIFAGRFSLVSGLRRAAAAMAAQAGVSPSS